MGLWAQELQPPLGATCISSRSRSTADPGGSPTASAQPPGQDWAACASQGTLEQAVLLGVPSKEGAEAW